MSVNGSGNLTYRWLAAILVALVVALSAAWAKSTQDDLGDAQRAIAILGERLARIETRVETVDSRTARIETKLDALGAR